jgi:hypothetical protein
MCLSTAAFLPHYIKNHTPIYYGRVSLSKNLYRYQKWGLGRSPKQGEGGSPTLSPFPRGRGLGIGIENLQYFLKINFFYKLTRPFIMGVLFSLKEQP